LIEHPRIEELIEAVATWIDGIRDSLPSRDAYLARVAVNALGVVRREIDLGPRAGSAAAGRLTQLLGQKADLKVLNIELCKRIRAGEMDVTTPGLLNALKANITEQIAIDQPGYKPDLGQPRKGRSQS
jgi:hypothetical protein